MHTWLKIMIFFLTIFTKTSYSVITMHVTYDYYHLRFFILSISLPSMLVLYNVICVWDCLWLIECDLLFMNNTTNATSGAEFVYLSRTLEITPGFLRGSSFSQELLFYWSSLVLVLKFMFVILFVIGYGVISFSFKLLKKISWRGFWFDFTV